MTRQEEGLKDTPAPVLGDTDEGIPLRGSHLLPMARLNVTQGHAIPVLSDCHTPIQGTLEGG